MLEELPGEVRYPDEGLSPCAAISIDGPDFIVTFDNNNKVMGEWSRTRRIEK